MKTSFKILVAFSFLICTFIGMGAYYVVSSKTVSITPIKMNIVYVGVDNPFLIKAVGVDPKNLIVKGTYGSSITPDTSGPGRYHVKVNEPGSTLTISVSEKTANGYTPLYSENFRAKKLPDPVVYAGNVKGDGDISQDELTAIKELTCKLENSDFDCSYVVVDYKMSVNQNGAWVDYAATTSELTAEMKTELANAGSGTRIFFHDVNVKGSDGQPRKLMGVNLTVR